MNEKATSAVTMSANGNRHAQFLIQSPSIFRDRTVNITGGVAVPWIIWFVIPFLVSIVHGEVTCLIEELVERLVIEVGNILLQ